MKFSFPVSRQLPQFPLQICLLPEVGERTIQDSSEPVVSPLPTILPSSPFSEVELKPRLHCLLPRPPPSWHSSPTGLPWGPHRRRGEARDLMGPS